MTGGGTGGHIYPALEVARLAEKQGMEILYLGSQRGQEGEICRQRGIRFHGFPSQPLVSLRTPAGWKAAVSLLRATGLAKSALRAAHPGVVFSTGGYSAAPVMSAARSLGIPYAIHEANSVPGRSNRMFAGKAAKLTCAFEATSRVWPQAVRTGNPIRQELRDAVATRADFGSSVVVLGGSQGSAFLNEAVPEASVLLGDGVRFLHAAGRRNYRDLVGKLQLGHNYKIVDYLETPQMVEAYLSSAVAVARSGSTVAEFALFGLSSVLVPLPASADDHQRENAKEFVAIGGATLVDERSATPEVLASAIKEWLDSPARRASAESALKAWSIPDATERIVELIMGIAR